MFTFNIAIIFSYCPSWSLISSWQRLVEDRCDFGWTPEEDPEQCADHADEPVPISHSTGMTTAGASRRARHPAQRAGAGEHWHIGARQSWDHHSDLIKRHACAETHYRSVCVKREPNRDTCQSVHLSVSGCTYRIYIPLLKPRKTVLYFFVRSDAIEDLQQRKRKKKHLQMHFLPPLPPHCCYIFLSCFFFFF